ncbi:MAG: hypothetical protein QG646_4495, partial [Euryarchaeota archaeon]|nr:hypothetical protein [Euryarchaeota archaeon]
MVNRCMKLMLPVIMCFSLIITIQTVSCIASPPVIYVAGDNSGDFNCNATNAGSQINHALQFVASNPEYTTVYLKGPFTYMTNDTLLIGSDTTLTGDTSATIKLEDNANWNVSKPLVSANSSTHDIRIYGFTIDGNRNNNINVNSGQGYYNIFSFSNSQNIDIHNMCLANNHGDGLYTNKCTNIKFYSNRVYLLGHDGIYICNSNFIESYNNLLICRTNSGLRIYNSNHVSFHDNTITSQGSGGAGIEIQKEGTRNVMNDIEIYNNIIHDTVYAGIWIFGSGSYLPADTYIHVFNNCIYSTGTKQSSSLVGGILSDGFNGLIENNIINATYGSGISQANIYSSLPQGSGFVLTLKNNTITNTRNGYGINNALPGTHSFVLQSNYLNNNSPGDYYDITLPVPPIMPTASFYSNTSSGYSPLVVQFVDTSKNATSWSWNFGDNSAISPQQNPVHTFTEAGVYTVTLTASNINGTSSTSTQIVVSPKPVIPIASFDASTTSGTTTNPIAFTDASKNIPTSWSWNFGDGTTATTQNVSHRFTKAGKYTVSLTVKNVAGSAKATKTVTISTPKVPVASFKASTTAGTTTSPITFTDTSTNIPTSWSWNFGDGTTATTQNVSHRFTK